MDERADVQGKREKRSRNRRILAVGSAMLAAVCVVSIGIMIFRRISPKGYWDYTVQKEQYFVEY